ncbi:MAG TPA: hypothetical protein VEG34_12075 [Thermoanaerobaculia bacterium]|nr:hypothetical protein [Thermoanaerobaculia bacterium]
MYPSLRDAMHSGKKKKDVEYVPGAADDGYGFFPAITCQIAGKGAPQVLWVAFNRGRQLPGKADALAAAEDELRLAFRDRALVASAERFRAHLQARGFTEAADYRVAKSFEQDRREALGDEHQPPFGEAAARHDPLLHAAMMQMVDQQLSEKSPPEAAEALARLQAQGHPREESRRMIGLALAHELTESMLQGEDFDDQRYADKLRRLPELPPA